MLPTTLSPFGRRQKQVDEEDPLVRRRRVTRVQQRSRRFRYDESGRPLTPRGAGLRGRIQQLLNG